MRVRLKNTVLAQELAQRNLSQNHWAHKLGLSRSYLSMLVNGKRPYPGARTRRLLLEGLSLSFDDLFEVELPRNRVARSLARHVPTIFFTDHPRGDGIMTALRQNLTFSLRTLARNPTFTAMACLVLALGIGANAAIFSVVDTVLLRPLPYPDAGEIVRVFSYRKDPSEDSGFKVMSYPDFEDVRDQVSGLGDLALHNYGHVTLTGTGSPERLLLARTSSEFFSLVRATPALGRIFTPDEGRSEGPRVAVVSHRLWQRLFAGDPERLGSDVELDEESYTVVGVMPEGFRMPLELRSSQRVDLWVPVGPYAGSLGRGIRRFRVHGRLKPGVSADELRDQLGLVASRLEASYPKSNEDQGLGALPMHEVVVGDSRPLLSLLGGVVALILLISCANVANLLLSRNAGRTREVAIRTALGAGRLRITTQLLVESIVLGLVAAVPALLVAVFLQRFLVAQLAADLPRLDDVGLDLRLFGFTLVLALSTGVAFGLLPAWLAGKTRFGTALKEAGHSTSPALGSRRLRGVLAVSEIALALVVLMGAGLLLNSLWRLGNVAPGFVTDDVVVSEVLLSSRRYDDQAKEVFYRRLLEEASSLAGVEQAGLVTYLPLDGGFSCDSFGVEDLEEDWQPCAEFRMSSPGYFEALGVRLLRGRGFTAEDRRDAVPVAVVNEALARRTWPGEEALGKKVKYGSRSSEGPWHTVVGVVADTRQIGLARETAPELHLPIAQGVWVPSSVKMVVRSVVEPSSLAGSLRERLHSLDADLPLLGVTTMEQVLRDSIARPRSRAVLLAAFASAALLLAVAGIYAVMAYSVNQRSHEIGIRVALGARRFDVVRLVVGQGLGLTALGLLLGILGALGLTRVLSNLLYGVTATDPATFVLVSAVLCGVAMLASYLPARGAAALNPLETLRHE